ncbi:polysaccharide biosynthesis protein [Pseudooceanicola sp. 200-1SW]|uniref:polysaccharide biosynthesis protein n=1 Tax=Pseudooceanicola sp. 200-1SW TaxID=3425949 RepID=UPI003D7FE5D7
MSPQDTPRPAPLPPGRRALDLAVTLTLLACLWPLLLLLAALVWLCDGAPVLYPAERMLCPDRPFILWKFRTMAPDPRDRGVTGGDKARRITPLGRHLRRWRLDELPQLWNLLRGEITLIGPRPPLRAHVAARPALFAQVLRSRPGLTGLATLRFHAREAALLAPCRDAVETERIYLARCLPAKARLDLWYARRRSLGLDLWILARTIWPARRRRPDQAHRNALPPGPRLARTLTRLGPRAKARILRGLDLGAVLLAWGLLALGLPGLASPDLLLPGLGLVAAGGPLLGLDRLRLRAFALRGLPRCLGLAAALAAALALWQGLRGAPTLAPALLLPPLWALAAIAGRQALLALALRAHAAARAPTRILIWGAGQRGLQLAAALAGDRHHRCLGFLDEDPRKQGQRLGGLPVHSPTRARALVARQPPDQIVLALPRAAWPHARATLADLPCEVLSLPGFAARLWGGEEGAPPDLPRLLGRADLERQLPEVRDSYAGRRILVTGAGGSIGSELCRQLLRLGPARLVLLDQGELALYTITTELEATTPHAATRLRPVLGSVTDAPLLDELLATEGIDTIFHAAALKHVPLVEAHPLEGIRTNVLGTQTLAEAARRAGVARFLLISTDKAVRPGSVMGAAKRLAEEVVQDLATRSPDTRFAMVRFGNVLGSSGSVIPRFAAQIAAGGPVTVTHPQMTRYFMTCAEAVRLTLLAGARARGGEVFVLDMGAPQRILDLACRMIRGAGKVPRLPPDGPEAPPPEAPSPAPEDEIEIRFTGLRPGEKLTEDLLIAPALDGTPHPRILRAREDHLSQIEVAAALAELRRCLDARDPPGAVAALHRWVARGQAPRPAELSEDSG